MSVVLDNATENCKRLTEFFDRHAQVVVTETAKGPFVVALLSGTYLDQSMFLFKELDKLPPAQSFVQIAEYGIMPPTTLLRKPSYGLLYKEYRKVDISHVNKLHNRTELIVTDLMVHDTPALSGIAALPNGFIVATAINKTAAGAAFDRAVGQRYLHDDLVSKVDERLWELEGYRVYRAVNTLDSISAKLDDGDLAIRLLANGASATLLTDVNYVIISAERAPDNLVPDGRRIAVVKVVDYYKIITILDTYIERGVE